MFLQSLRWRLPLTYAAIAMIAALALGVVLLTTLRSYYAQAEWEYLFSNAQATRRIIHELENQNVPREDINAQLQNIAFLAQVRVQRLDEDHNLVSDSGIPDDNILSIARRPGVRIFNTRFYEQA
ncbi:MAG: hypothetical protein K8J31_22735, partial [Anaerolineae bacterium]|nr:hypothetical protein [Anaerolineae bacterium]